MDNQGQRHIQSFIAEKKILGSQLEKKQVN